MDDTVNSIINKHVLFSMTSGAIPLPLADIAAVTAVQMDMIKQIANHYKIPYDENVGKSIASSLTGASLAKVGASLIKSLPGVGTAVGIGTQVVLSGASTYALGKIFESHFSESGSFSDLNVDMVKDKYEELLKKGKKFAEDVKGQLKSKDAFKQIDKLKKLKDNGSITEEEFEKTKKKLLDKITEGKED